MLGGIAYTMMEANMKITDEVRYDAAIVRRATHFTTFMQVCLGDRRRIECATYDEAVSVAHDLEQQFGKRALIYAVCGQYQASCTPEVMEAANG
jgi:hypothetical protein